jgi:long-chain acyl-CoA synthetase
MDNIILSKDNARLFDFLDLYVQQYPNKIMFGYKDGSEWKTLTATQVADTTLQLANGIVALNLYKTDDTAEGLPKVSIISANKPEWCIADWAIQQAGAVSVPLYPTLSEIEMAYILNEAQVQAIFVGDKKLMERVLKVQAQVPTLKHVFALGNIDGATSYTSLLKPLSEEDAARIKQIKSEVKPEDLFTIIYTSGTTGNPKGVMLSHKNIASNVLVCMPCFHFCEVSGKALSFLPLNHIFERMVMHIYVKKCISIYFAQGMETIGDNLREVKPDLFTTVPRLLEKVYERIVDKGTSLTGFKRKIFDWSLALSEKYNKEGNSTWYNVQHAIANKLVYGKWREAIGGNVKAIITGSAACQVRLLKVFGAANLTIMEGFGLTETSPVVTVNRHESSGRSFGTVGMPMENQEVKLAEDGEILCKGDHIMLGYYKRPDLTAEVLKDGWFHTGDIGVWQDEKFLKITDRKKELFKLSAGKYIAPQVLENKLKESALIEQIMVVGSNQKFVGALIVPNVLGIKDALAKQGIIIANKQELLGSADVQKLVRQELNTYNKNFSEWEHVKRFQLVPDEWTIDGGEMTPTLKLKRKVIYEKYASLVDKIFVN